MSDDTLGSHREGTATNERYQRAFDDIDADPNQKLIVGRLGTQVVATLQLSILPTLTHLGTKRGQIESVRVATSVRGQGVGEAMIQYSIDVASRLGCGLIQLTTDRSRVDALKFYDKLGFVDSHHGLKYWIN